MEKTRGCVNYTAALPFTLKSILRQTKDELWKIKYFTMQKCNFQKNPLKETKILPDIITLCITNLKFQHKPKYIIFQKSSYKNRPIIIT